MPEKASQLFGIECECNCAAQTVFMKLIGPFFTLPHTFMPAKASQLFSIERKCNCAEQIVFMKIHVHGSDSILFN